MAKAPAAPVGKNLAKTGGTDLAAASIDFLSGRAGQGFQNVGMNDIVMPRVNILQSLSPQLKQSKPEYLPGAKEGQLFNAASRLAVDSMRVIPVHYIRHHLEWKPNRGGLVADHGDGPEAEALLKTARRDDKNFDILPNGNILVPTGTWYCIDANTGQQLIIPMSRTQLKPSRTWMSMATSERIVHPVNGEFQPPLFFRSYDLKSTLRSEGENDWYVFNVERGPTIFELDREDLLSAATRFQDMLVSGDIRADASSFGEDDGPGGGRDTGAM